MKKLGGLLAETYARSRRVQQQSLLRVCLPKHRDHRRYVNDDGTAERCKVDLWPAERYRDAEVYWNMLGESGYPYVSRCWRVLARWSIPPAGPIWKGKRADSCLDPPSFTGCDSHQRRSNSVFNELVLATTASFARAILPNIRLDTYASAAPRGAPATFDCIRVVLVPTVLQYFTSRD